MHAIDLTGQTFGRLTAKERVGSSPHDCACGESKITSAASLRHGWTRSCGCLKAESNAARNKARATHGQSKQGSPHGSPTYYSWRGMRDRCKPQHVAAKRYHVRGIAVCERWQTSFENFLADMGERPAGATLDRIDNDRGYEPGNCRWATPRQQANNRSNSRARTTNGGASVWAA